ncbi:unnamed protein product, partial [Durusdinium trenchii]
PDDLQSPLPRFGASSGNVPATQLTAPGWIQDSTTGRPISARAGISGGRSIPRGFVPAQAKVEVYSYSLSRWYSSGLGLCHVRSVSQEVHSEDPASGQFQQWVEDGRMSKYS